MEAQIVLCLGKARYHFHDSEKQKEKLCGKRLVLVDGDSNDDEMEQEKGMYKMPMRGFAACAHHDKSKSVIYLIVSQSVVRCTRHRGIFFFFVCFAVRGEFFFLVSISCVICLNSSNEINDDLTPALDDGLV